MVTETGLVLEVGRDLPPSSIFGYVSVSVSIGVTVTVAVTVTVSVSDGVAVWASQPAVYGTARVRYQSCLYNAA